MSSELLYPLVIFGVIGLLFIITYIRITPAARERAKVMMAEMEAERRVEADKNQQISQVGAWVEADIPSSVLAAPQMDTVTFKQWRKRPSELRQTLGIVRTPSALPTPMGQIAVREIYRDAKSHRYGLLTTSDTVGVVEYHQLGEGSQDVLMVGTVGSGFFVYWNPIPGFFKTPPRIIYDAGTGNPVAEVRITKTDIGPDWLYSLDKINLADNRTVKVKSAFADDGALRFQDKTIIETRENLQVLPDAPSDMVPVCLFALMLFDYPSVR